MSKTPFASAEVSSRGRFDATRVRETVAQRTTAPGGTRVLRRPQVEAATGLGRSTIYEMIARGEFPTPIKLGARAVGWIESEIEQWLDHRKDQRDLD